ncbi:MAG: class II aldolase/adducin family protein [Candidatus Bathyarchaeia archaeon]
MDSLAELKEKLVRACRILYNEGATTEGKGHQSYLLERDKILIPRHLHSDGLGLGDVQVDDILVIDFDGKVLEGKYKEPMGEFYIHTSIFKARSDVKSIVHVHPPYLNALACAGQNILPICKESLFFRDGIAFYERFPLYIGDKEHGEAAAKALGNKKALIHRGHGAIIVGRSIEEALLLSLYLERAAKIQWMASVFGQPKPLPREEMKRCKWYDVLDDKALKEGFLYYSKKLEKHETKAGKFNLS